MWGIIFARSNTYWALVGMLAIFQFQVSGFYGWGCEKNRNKKLNLDVRNLFCRVTYWTLLRMLSNNSLKNTCHFSLYFCLLSRVFVVECSSEKKRSAKRETQREREERTTRALWRDPRPHTRARAHTHTHTDRCLCIRTSSRGLWSSSCSRRERVATGLLLLILLLLLYR